MKQISLTKLHGFILDGDKIRFPSPKIDFFCTFFMLPRSFPLVDDEFLAFSIFSRTRFKVLAIPLSLSIVLLRLNLLPSGPILISLAERLLNIILLELFNELASLELQEADKFGAESDRFFMFASVVLRRKTYLVIGNDVTQS